MEVKIPKEIRNYTEAIFFGLTLRQLLFSATAVAVAVFLFFTFRGSMHLEALSWLCILGALPFAAMGFIRYHGMTFEQFVWSVIKSEILMPIHLLFKSKNTLMELTNPITKKYQKEHRKSA